MKQILDSVSEEDELASRIKDLPEVKAFVEIYKNSSRYINTDYHIGVDYVFTECKYSGKHCHEARPAYAELEIIMSLDTGYPDHSHFWCNGNEYKMLL